VRESLYQDIYEASTKKRAEPGRQDRQVTMYTNNPTLKTRV